jgi:transposase-like protein
MTRKITSLVALLAFALTIVTSLVLYIAPQGRVAYWSDWTLLGLDKTQWGNLHVNLGTLFLAALALHAFYNWKAVTTYLSRARKLVVFTPAFVAACVIVLAVGLGTFAMLPPFSSFLAGSDYFKERASQLYGEPPYGHAELSPIASLAPKIGMTPEGIVTALRKAGYTEAAPDATLQSLARIYGVSPQRLYQAFAPAETTQLPELPPAGTGNRTLAELCRRHGLDVKRVVAGLAAKGITAAPDATIKVIGEQSGQGPLEVYAAIREIAAAAGK